MYYNLFDSHTHSENSPDGEHSVAYMAEMAILRGLRGLAITDHCEGDSFDMGSFEMRVRQSALDLVMARASFGGRLILTFGIEVAQVFHDLESVGHVLDMLPYDFVLGAQHSLLYDGFDFITADYSQLTPGQIHGYILKYYEELADFVRWGKFDVLAHLGFPVRYPRLNGDIAIGLERYHEQIDLVLRLLAENGKGMEINTASLRNGVIDVSQYTWALRRFRELGGEIVTLGSDANNVGDIGAGIENGMQLLVDAGYTHFAFFREKKPVMLRII